MIMTFDQGRDCDPALQRREMRSPWRPTTVQRSPCVRSASTTASA